MNSITTPENARSSSTEILGVIGTGHFASYLIAALRRGGFRETVLLSPRNAGIATELARNYGCQIAKSNEEVMTGASVILLSVRPQHAIDVLGKLRWQSHQTALSAIAGLPVGELQNLVQGAGAVHAIMPASFIEAGRGPIPLYPPSSSLLPLLSHAGDVIELTSQEAFDASLISACFSTWIYNLADAVAQSLENQGLTADAARALALGNIAGPAHYALMRSDQTLSAISDSIATERTFTRTGLDHLRARDFDAPWREAIEMVGSLLRKSREEDAS